MTSPLTQLMPYHCIAVRYQVQVHDGAELFPRRPEDLVDEIFTVGAERLEVETEADRARRDASVSCAPHQALTLILHLLGKVTSFEDLGTLLFFLIVCFTSYFVFSIAVLPHNPGVVYYHLLLRRETRIPGVAPFSFRIGIWDLFVHIGQKSYTPTAFGKLWTTPGVRCMQHASS